MIRLRQFIAEATEESKLKHMTHVEDHVVDSGSKGFAHAYHTLNAVHEKLVGKTNATKVSMKYDGSPSVMFGYHPETGKFFVGSKSVFNKDPKINYTPEDIDKNHGHAPGLVSKLKAALEHLPKAMPEKKGVYQADIMHTPEDLNHEGHRISHTPQLITYHHKTNSDEGKKAANSKIGVAIHTQYEGKTFADMTVKQGHIPEMKDHKDVHQFPMHHELQHVAYTKDNQNEYKTHMANAMDSYKKTPKEAFAHGEKHADMLNTHINQSVRKNTSPSAEGFKEHLKTHYAKKASGVKTPQAKERHDLAGKRHIASINDSHINQVLQVHKHLQKAKDSLTNAFNTHHIHGHEVDGEPTNPEGYVIHHNDRPSKFVLRHEFSRQNFAKNDARSKAK